MANPQEIVGQDAIISEILDANPYGAAADLFERYLVVSASRDAFVAALIGRLVMREARERTRCTERDSVTVSIHREIRE